MQQLPHENIVELRNIRTMADVRRFQENPQLMKKYANLKPGSPSFKEFNERIGHIQRFNIEGPATQQETPQQTAQNEAYQSIREWVSRLTAKNCGSSNSGAGGGPWTKTNNLKKELFRVIDLNEKRGTLAEKVAKYVDDEINKLASSSVN
jgi:hypothetical protein